MCYLVCAHVGLRAAIVRGLVPSSRDRQIVGARVVVRLVEVVERRHRQHRFGRERVYPVGDQEGVALVLRVAQAEGLVVLAGLLPVVLDWGRREPGKSPADTAR